MSRFLEALQSGRVLLMDGAMGTQLQYAGIAEGECYESWNLTHPEKVRSIHQAYADAGAELLLTNTFQANWAALGSHGHKAAAVRLQRQAVDLARTAAPVHGFVFYDVGPLNEAALPAAAWTPLQVEYLTLGMQGADGVLLETFSDTTAVCVGRHMRRSGQLPAEMPLLMSLTYQRHAVGGIGTSDAQEPEYWACAALDIGVAALGVNCGRDIGMDEIIEIIRRYRQVIDLPLFARPNAGTPTREDDRWVYPLTPEKMAERLPELLEAGVSMVGGCCGTTPEHIAAMRPIIDAWNARHVTPGPRR
jgi:5-methyltetrahydrofolate--homocysteine methyltransferase